MNFLLKKVTELGKKILKGIVRRKLWILIPVE
jgi:hypothetical protein